MDGRKGRPMFAMFVCRSVGFSIDHRVNSELMNPTSLTLNETQKPQKGWVYNSMIYGNLSERERARLPSSYSSSFFLTTLHFPGLTLNFPSFPIISDSFHFIPDTTISGLPWPSDANTWRNGNQFVVVSSEAAGWMAARGLGAPKAVCDDRFSCLKLQKGQRKCSSNNAMQMDDLQFHSMHW